MIAGALCSACVGVYPSLPAERADPEYSAALELAAHTPARVELVTAGEAAGAPVRLAIEEVGTGTATRIDVLIHGVVSDRRTWRYVAALLAQDRDCMLVDLPGCGESDRPDPDVVGDEPYSPTAMARSVLAALRPRLERRGAARVTLVGHSLGTSVILRMLGDPAIRAEYADLLAQVDRAVLVSPVAFAVERKDPLLERIANLTDLEVALGELTGLLRDGVAVSIRDGAGDPRAALREECDRVVDILSDASTRRPAQAMLRAAIPWTRDGRCDWGRIEALEDDYENVRVPCLLVSGGRDETVPQAMGFRLRELLPEAWLRVIPGAMHCLPTECPGVCAGLIRGFDASGGAGWMRFEGRRPASIAAR